MASKRQLYQPAPKARAGERKGRKPLVQGRLVALGDSNGGDVDLINASPRLVIQGQEQIQNNNQQHQRLPKSSQGDSSNTSANRSRSSHDELLDPSITPRKSVPALTEILSPQPEPPSRYLDLSDADLGIEDVSARSKPQPVMVCDASFLASSSNHTEVDVVINYEDSPVRVVCHTPSRLESSLRSIATSDKKKQAVVVDAPKTVGLVPARLFSDDLPPSSDGSDGTEPLISQQSRGLIKEILAEEMGSENMDAISLYSHNSSSPRNPAGSSPKNLHSIMPHRYPLNSSLIDDNEKLKHSNLTRSGDKDDASSVSSLRLSPPRDGKDLSRNHKTSKSSESLKKNMVKHGIVITPNIRSEDSDSETLSLYEYVTHKKPAQTGKREMKTDSAGTSGLSQESSSSSLPKSTKKGKARRVVPSRYKQAAAASKSLATSLAKDSSTESSASRSAVKSRPENTKSKAPIRKNAAVKKVPQKTFASQTSSVYLSDQGFHRARSPPTAVQDHSGDGKEAGTIRQTSTPTHDYPEFPNYMDASSIQSVSALSVDASLNFSKLPELLDQKSVSTSTKAKLDRGLPEKNLPLQLDIEYSRYLQACFLSSKARKAFREQDRSAMKDLNSLWNLVEKQREVVCKADRDLSRLKQIHHLDNFLDKTDPELNALGAKLPQVQGDYLKLCHALDTTRHQIPTKDIHLPPADEDVREAYEEKIESVLKESEMLLNEISKVVDARVHPLSQYRTCLEALKQNITAIGSHLREGHTDLEKAQGLCTKLASLATIEK